MERLPVISLEEVSYHDNAGDCWVVVHNQVYDITKFVFQHPGGESVLLEHAGRDASLTFVEAGHNLASLVALNKYLIGILPESEYFNNTVVQICYRN